jgi:hypothetical protein
MKIQLEVANGKKEPEKSVKIQQCMSDVFKNCPDRAETASGNCLLLRRRLLLDAVSGSQRLSRLSRLRLPGFSTAF